MRRAIRAAAWTSLILAVTGTVAEAQYGWPPYANPSPYGWVSPYGWGYGFADSTVQGDIKRGEGVRLWGEGEFIRNYAIAEAIHMQTITNYNEYLWLGQQARIRNYWAQQEKDQEHRRALHQIEEQRIRCSPEPLDIYKGTAMNRVLDELSNPKIDPVRLVEAAKAVDPALVRQVAMYHAPTRLTFDFQRLMRSPLPTKIRLEVAGPYPVKFALFRREVEGADEVNLAELVQFMRAFGLKFGEAKSAEQRAAYDALYPRLVALRDAIAPQSDPRVALEMR